MSTDDDATEQANRSHKGLIDRYPIVFFFILAFVFTWCYFALFVILDLPKPLMALGAAGPAVSAFFILSVTSGKPGVLRLLHSYIHWRVGVQWYLITLIGIQVLMVLSYLVVPGTLADFHAPTWSFLPRYFSEFAFTLFLSGGPLLEEGGWRGFALPRLQQQYGPIIGTLILGVFWGLWHLPFFFGPLAATGPDATIMSASIAFIEFTIGLIGVSIVMTWILNNSGGSVLMAILIHAAFDQSPVFTVLFPSTQPYYIPVHFQTLGIAVVFSITSIIIIVLTRGQLGYQNFKKAEKG